MNSTTRIKTQKARSTLVKTYNRSYSTMNEFVKKENDLCEQFEDLLTIYTDEILRLDIELDKAKNRCS